MPRPEAITAVGIRIALGARPDLVWAVQRLADAAEGEAIDAEVRAAVQIVLAGAYFMAPEVRRDLGYRGPRPIPIIDGEVAKLRD